MTSALQIPPNSDLTLGMVCVDKSRPGRTTWKMAADERFANPAGKIQGGFLAAFCDTAMSAAAVTFARGRPTPPSVATTDLGVSFVAPVPVGVDLTCEAAVVTGGGRVAFTEASLTGPDGTLYVRARATLLYGAPRVGGPPELAGVGPSGEDGGAATSTRHQTKGR